MIFLNNKGLRPDTKKNSFLDMAVENVHCGKSVLIPVISAGSSVLWPVSEPGQRVFRNGIIAASASGNHTMLSPISGVYMGSERINHPLTGEIFCIKVSVNEKLPDAVIEKNDRLHASGGDIIKISKGAGIIDEYDGLPLYQKLLAFQSTGTDLLAGNAVDDMPYCSSGVKTVCEWGADVAAGLELCMRAAGAVRGTVFVYDSGGKSVKRIKDKYSIINTELVSGKYPLWPALEKKLIKKHSFGKIGVQALRALYYAVSQGIPQREAVVTVAGDGIKKPANCCVTIGTPVSRLIEHCGAEAEDMYCILGGAMNGKICTDLSVPIIPGVRSVTLLKKRQAPSSKSRCIGCGRCIETCPAKIMPMYIARFAEQGNFEEASAFGADKCTECGVCTAVCPSDRELFDTVLRVKYKDFQNINIYDWGEDRE